MPNIKPVSDLRNYSDVLHDVTALDMQDFEKMQATLRLMNELAKGRKSGEEKGWRNNWGSSMNNYCVLKAAEVTRKNFVKICRFVKHMLHHQARNHLKQFEEISIPAGA